jgi:hypothetical protein
MKLPRGNGNVANFSPLETSLAKHQEAWRIIVKKRKNLRSEDFIMRYYIK